MKAEEAQLTAPRLTCSFGLSAQCKFHQSSTSVGDNLGAGGGGGGFFLREPAKWWLPFWLPLKLPEKGLRIPGSHLVFTLSRKRVKDQASPWRFIAPGRNWSNFKWDACERDMAPSRTWPRLQILHRANSLSFLWVDSSFGGVCGASNG